MADQERKELEKEHRLKKQRRSVQNAVNHLQGKGEKFLVRRNKLISLKNYRLKLKIFIFLLLLDTSVEFGSCC